MVFKTDDIVFLRYNAIKFANIKNIKKKFEQFFSSFLKVYAKQITIKYLEKFIATQLCAIFIHL